MKKLLKRLLHRCAPLLFDKDGNGNPFIHTDDCNTISLDYGNAGCYCPKPGERKTHPLWKLLIAVIAALAVADTMLHWS